MYVNFSKWLADYIERIQSELITKTGNADIAIIRYKAGQLEAARVIQINYDQLRKEGSKDA